MTEPAKSVIQRVLYALAGAAVMGWVSAGLWAYNDRVTVDKEQNQKITSVDTDLQAYKLKVAETMPDKEDLQDLKRAIASLQQEMQLRH